MTPGGRHRRDLVAIFSIPFIGAVLVLAQLAEGGALGALVQPTAALVVFGGTLGALLLSYPFPLLRRTMASLRTVFSTGTPPDQAMVARFEHLATVARKRGFLSLEPEIRPSDDPFFARAITLVVDGVPAAEARRALESFSQTREAADEECAEVLEAAAGYTPTLGILGTVLGLIQVMENLSTPSTMGSGLAVAFVATVYGVGSANLILMPLATRLRALARDSAVTRELIIEATVAIKNGVHPRLVATQLGGFIRAAGPVAVPARRSA
jgi:chemotaxis protein MotA